MKIDQKLLDTIWKQKGLKFVECNGGFRLILPWSSYPKTWTKDEVIQHYLSDSPLMKALS